MHALAYRALPFGTGKNQPNRAGWHGHARSPLRPYEALRRDRSTCFRSSRRSFLVIEPRSKDVETESYLANAVAFTSGRSVSRSAAIWRNALSASFLAFKAACDKKHPTYFRPSRLRQTTECRPNPITLRQRYVVEVEGTYNGHAIIQ